MNEELNFDCVEWQQKQGQNSIILDQVHTACKR